MASPIHSVGIKSTEHDYAKTQTLKPKNATYTAPIKFAAFTNPAPVHSNLGDFLMNSTGMLHQQTAATAQNTAVAKTYQGYTPNKNVSLEQSAFNKTANNPEQPKIEQLQNIQQRIQAPLQNTAQPQKMADHANVNTQPKLPISDKGYGSKLATDPMLSIMANRTTTDSAAVSFGYIGAVNRRENSSADGRENSKEFSMHRESKPKQIKLENMQMHTAQKVEAIETLKEVTKALTKQLQKSHPCISVPIQHPDGIVDINLRFSSNGSVRALFVGSNPEVVQLLAQHRDQFINTIKDEGYNIDERQMGFTHQALTSASNNIRI